MQPSLSGNFAFFGEEFHSKAKSSHTFEQALHNRIIEALALRCQHLEDGTLPANVVPAMIAPVPAMASPGLFAQLVKEGGDIRITLSSAHSCNSKAGPHDLLNTDPSEYGTDKSHQPTETWIELKMLETNRSIHPEAVGLKHGWSNSDHCHSFVIEAADVDGPWIELGSWTNDKLKVEGAIYPILESRVTGSRFHRFRIRMTAPNDTGKNYLMVAWFDVFGSVRDDWAALRN